MQYILILIVALFSNSVYSATDETQDISAQTFYTIDKKHQSFSSHFYSLYLHQPMWRSSNFNTIKSLETAVKEHSSNNRGILSASLIIKYKEMINNHYDNMAVFNFLRVLLDQNEWNSAKSLYELIKKEGDSTLISNASYIFSIYYFKRNEWKKTLLYLKGIINDLPDEDYHHALLMKGISLQRLSSHRESISYYKLILPTSKYYISARLNMAIANIRQGWWTDAHIIIENTLKEPETRKKEEPLNRLYLTLGYSFLNQEYYRNSRGAFRNIGLTSLYTNRALLGISLTASNQEDYIGALRTISLLKNKETFDLAVDESYLLLPYFYEKLQQPSTASAGYLEAVNYYQKRIAGIKTIIQSDIDPENYPINTKNNTMINIGKNKIIFSSKYPDYFIENYLILISYKPYLNSIDNKKLTEEYRALKAEYEATIVEMIRTILGQRIKHLNSYMDQARFGLARLYDNNLVTN